MPPQLNNEFYRLGFIWFPPSENPQGDAKEGYVTAPNEIGQPISVQSDIAPEHQKWKIIPGPDKEQEVYRIIDALIRPQGEVEVPVGEAGFSHASDEPGSFVTLSNPRDYEMKLLPQPGVGGPLLVTLHPKGPDSDIKYISVTEDNKLIIERREVDTGIKPAWLITPDEIVFNR